MKKGICLLLCFILLAGLLPGGALAANGPGISGGVSASICLAGGMDKTIYSADSEIERKILQPDSQTEARYLLPEGVSYDAATNTLSLTDFSAAALPAAARRGDAERGKRGVADLAVDGKTVFALEIAHGRFGPAAVNAVDRAVIIAPCLQTRLDLRDRRAGGAALVEVGVYARRERDGQHVEGKDDRQRKQQLFPFFAQMDHLKTKKSSQRIL